MDELILVGGGGHCSSCIDVIEQEGRFNIAGIIDLPEKVGQTLLGYPFIGTDVDLPALARNHRFFLITLGQIKSPQPRLKIYQLLGRLKVELPTIISPHAYVSPHTQIGEGTIIMHHSIVNANAAIGNNCILNSRALIEHDATIGDHCHISTGAIINGGTQIADETFIGSGAIIRDNISIGRSSLIGAGASVMTSLPDNSFQPG